MIVENLEEYQKETKKVIMKKENKRFIMTKEGVTLDYWDNYAIVDTEQGKEMCGNAELWKKQLCKIDESEYGEEIMEALEYYYNKKK